MSTKSTAIYRVLLREAWRSTWQHKALWIFGLFAGLISSGGAIEAALSGMRQVTHTGSWLTTALTQGFTGHKLAAGFLTQFLINPATGSLFLMVATVLAVLLIAFGILSQGALIHGAGSPNKSLREMLHVGHDYFWEVFCLDLLTKVAMIVLTMVTTLSVVFLLTTNSAFASGLLFVHLLIYLPAVIIIHTLSTLAIIDVIESDRSTLHAIHHALTIFKKHWLSTLEFGFILFTIVLVVGLVLLTLLTLLTIPYAIIYTSTLLTGSLPLFLFVNAFFVLMVLGLILLAGSAIVTFQYTAWRLFYKRAVHRVHGNKVISKLRRLLVH